MGYFDCSDNKLSSLEFSPKKINGNFWCNKNKLTSLLGAPQKIGNFRGDFDCSDNFLTSLEFCPTHIAGQFICNKNNLTSLDFCPNKASKFYCEHNQGLGNLQNINDFKIIYAEHLKQKIIIEFNNKLNRELVDNVSHPKKLKL